MAKHIIIKNSGEFFNVRYFYKIILEWFQIAVVYVVSTIYAEIAVF